jgi:hypothetical protein
MMRSAPSGAQLSLKLETLPLSKPLGGYLNKEIGAEKKGD